MTDKRRLAPAHRPNQSKRKHIFRPMWGEDRCVSCYTARDWPLAQYGCGTQSDWVAEERRRRALTGDDAA